MKRRELGGRDLEKRRVSLQADTALTYPPLAYASKHKFMKAQEWSQSLDTVFMVQAGLLASSSVVRKDYLLGVYRKT